MNTREIRIGNYVEVKGRIVKVDSILGDGKEEVEIVTPEQKLETVKIAEVKPVPLTGDILMKCCEFDTTGKHIIGIDDHRHYLKLKDGYVTLLNNKYEDMIHFWDVQSLHQLQNLYFALKGKEMVAVL